MLNGRQSWEANVETRKKAAWVSAAEASAIGIEMVVALVVGWFVGSRIDRYFHTNPWFTIVFFLAGVGATIKAMVRVARAYKRENPDPSDAPPPPPPSPPPSPPPGDGNDGRA